MIQIGEIMDDAVKAIRANYRVRNQKVFSEIPERHTRLVTERKQQIREWIAVVRILQDPLNHGHVLARVTDLGEHSGRNLMGHGLRARVILGGSEAVTERASNQQRHQTTQLGAASRKMPIDEIHRRIEELSTMANSRRLECDPIISTVMGGASIDFMTPSERKELHELQQQLPTFADLREQAHKRIQQRIAMRNQQKEVPHTSKMVENQLEMETPMNLGTHVIQFPAGRWGYVGSLPLELGTMVPATKADILGCRTVGKDSDGKPLAAKFPSFETEAEALKHAEDCGVVVTPNIAAPIQSESTPKRAPRPR